MNNYTITWTVSVKADNKEWAGYVAHSEFAKKVMLMDKDATIKEMEIKRDK